MTDESKFKNRPCEANRNSETWRDLAAERIASIGAAELREWYLRVRNQTSPGTYGQFDCELAFSVAYDLHHGLRRDHNNPRMLTEKVIAIWNA